MCLPPFDEPPLGHFHSLSRLKSDLGLPRLSMGMSGDFEEAIRSGSTDIRVGSALFGLRS